MSYDIIGDIHGHADKLVQLLEAMGYRDHGGCFEHPERTVVFVGDFVDRGPYQCQVIDIARSMVESGRAMAVMGNHEFNAIAYATPDPASPGAFLRPHEPKNRKQHRAFLEAYANDSAGREAAIEWFRTLPLFLELESGERVIHACWHEPSRVHLRDQLGPNHTLTAELLVRASRRGSPEYRAVETLLKGMEIDLPSGVKFVDKDGHQRSSVRVAWWRAHAETFDKAWFPEPGTRPPQLVGRPLPRSIDSPYPSDAPPVFFGHYWVPPIGRPAPQRSNIFCLDYSVASKRGGWLVAARTGSGTPHFTWV